MVDAIDYTIGTDPIVHQPEQKATTTSQEVIDVVSGRVRQHLKQLEEEITAALGLDIPIRQLAGNYIDQYLARGAEEPVTSTSHIERSPIGNVRVTDLSGGRQTKTAIQVAEDTLYQLDEKGCQVEVQGAEVKITLPRRSREAPNLSYTVGTPVATEIEHAQLAKGHSSIIRKSNGVAEEVDITDTKEGLKVLINHTDKNAGVVKKVGVFSSTLLFGTTLEGSPPLTVEEHAQAGAIAGQYEGLTIGGNTSLSEIVVVDPDDSTVWRGDYNQEGHSVTWKSHSSGGEELTVSNPVTVRAREGTLELCKRDGSYVAELKVKENILDHIPGNIVSVPHKELTDTAV